MDDHARRFWQNGAKLTAQRLEPDQWLPDVPLWVLWALTTLVALNAGLAIMFLISRLMAGGH